MKYDREEACRAWLTYGYFPCDQLTRLLDDFDGSAEAIYDRAVSKGSAFLRDYIPAQKVAVLMGRAEKDAMHEMLLTMQKLDMHIMSKDDLGYPDQLLNIKDPPALLFWMGNPDCLSGHLLTFVGSRHATLVAEQATEEITAALSRAGVSIVSGMANGIDQASHRGCLQGPSPTVAVLGCGLDVPYPSGSQELKRKLLDQGGVMLSEYHPGRPQVDFQFPIRNRILSGLGKAVVMMECNIRSGSMTTVRHALDQGRDVYAWPGVPGSESTEGAHMLLREGALYFTSADDLLEDMGWGDLPGAVKQEPKPLSQLTPEQREICIQLRKGDKTLDELAYITEMDTPVLSSALTMLDLLGYIRSMPGKSYHLI